jgi:hypothetical protein
MSKNIFALTVVLLLAGCGGGTAPQDAQEQCNSKTLIGSQEISGQDGFFRNIDQTVISLKNTPNIQNKFFGYDIASYLSYVYGFFIHDFDCDQKPDVSFFDNYRVNFGGTDKQYTNGYIQWASGELENFAKEDYLPEIAYENQAVVLFERHLAFDINNDGLMDIVGVVNSHSAVAAYLNPGKKNQAWERVYIAKNLPAAPINIAIGDLDGDNAKDIIISMRYQQSTNPTAMNGGLVWLKKNPANDLTYEAIFVSGSDKLMDPRFLAVFDADKDGKDEILVGDSSGTGQMYEFKYDRANQFTSQSLTEDILLFQAHYGVARDFDGDGYIDILTPVYNGIGLIKNVQGKKWEFSKFLSFESENSSLLVTALDVGDLNNDGRTDVVFTIGSSPNSFYENYRGGLYVAFNNTDSWAVERVYEEASSFVGVKLADLDGDNNLDIVANIEYPRNAISAWLNRLNK